MRKMHPEIKKFWEEAGHEVIGPTLIGSWEIHIDCGGWLPIRKIETICHGDWYHYDKKWYSEEEMLKIVRLKAFI